MKCCSPERTEAQPRVAPQPPPTGASEPGPTSDLRMIQLPGGVFTMGDDGQWHYPDDGEAPARPMVVAPFAIAATAVSNEQFKDFVDKTGYVSEAEQFEWSFVFAGLLPNEFQPTRGVAEAPWWRQVYGATWRTPEGPHSSFEGRADHPVVHVTCNDAMAYAIWHGVRLPTEAEWEYACRAGSTSTFWWGDELLSSGAHMINVFQGDFPEHNTAEDGWPGTCPVDAFAANAFGLHNTLGNVWEWTSDLWNTQDRRVMKGGSYLCHESYCRRYRCSARMSSTIDSSAGNIGFRIASDAIDITHQR